MTAIRIENFGGEQPSLSNQAMPPEAAQVNENLFAAIREFRPLMQDCDVCAAPTGTRSIYRTQRKGAGDLYNGLDNEGDTATWLISPKELSYVKGQVNDDATERTYFTTDDGSDYPKAFDLSSIRNPRKLGVPPPATATAEIVKASGISRSEAEAHLAIVAKKITDAVLECTIDPRVNQRGARYTDYTPSNGVPRAARLTPRAGAKTNYGMGPTEEIAAVLPAAFRTADWKLYAARSMPEMVAIFGKPAVDTLCVTAQIEGLTAPPDWTDLFTEAEARAHLKTVAKAITDAVLECTIDPRVNQRGARYTDYVSGGGVPRATTLKPRAGATSNYGMGPTEEIRAYLPSAFQNADWKLYATRSSSDINAIFGASAAAAYGVSAGGNTAFHMDGLPYCLVPDIKDAATGKYLLELRLRAITHPYTKAPLFSEVHIAGLLDTLIEGSKMQRRAASLLAQMDTCTRGFAALVFDSSATGVTDGQRSSNAARIAQLQSQSISLSQQIEDTVLGIWRDEMRDTAHVEGALLVSPGLNELYLGIGSGGGGGGGDASGVAAAHMDGLPYCLVPDIKDAATGKYLLELRLRAITHPKTNRPLFSEVHIAGLLDTLIEGSKMQRRAPELLTRMDDCTRSFSELVFDTNPATVTTDSRALNAGRLDALQVLAISLSRQIEAKVLHIWQTEMQDTGHIESALIVSPGLTELYGTLGNDTVLTLTDAKKHLKGVIRRIAADLRDCIIDPRVDQRGSRYTDYTPSNGTPRSAKLTPRAGGKSNYGMGPTEEIKDFLPPIYQDMDWRLYAVRATSELEALLGKQGLIAVGALSANGNSAVSMDALPFCLIPDRKDPATGGYLIETRLRAFKHPKTGAQLFAEEYIAGMVDTFVEGSKMQRRAPDLLSQMDACTREFSQLIFDTPLSSVVNAASKPVEPPKPTGPEFITDPTGGGDGTPTTVRSPDWIKYDKDMVSYRAALADWQAKQGDTGQSQQTLVDKVAALQARAVQLSSWIEDKVLAAWHGEMQSLSHLEKALVDTAGYFGIYGEEMIDAERVKTPRFYVATYVTDWGEESAPSPVTTMIEPHQYDSVGVTVSLPPSGRHIEKLRLYRSNAGSMGAAFQFVVELATAATPSGATVAAWTDSFTEADARAHLKTVAKAITDAVLKCTIDPRVDQRGSRYTGYIPSNGIPKAARLTPRAGAASNYGMGPTEEIRAYLPDAIKDMDWRLYATRPEPEMVAIFGSGAAFSVSAGGNTAFHMDGLPYCLVPDIKDAATGKYLLELRLRAITHPVTSAPLFSEVHIAGLLDTLIEGSKMQRRAPELLSQMDACTRDFAALVFDTTPGAVTDSQRSSNAARIAQLQTLAVQLSAQIENRVLSIWHTEMQDTAHVESALLVSPGLNELYGTGSGPTDPTDPTDPTTYTYVDKLKGAELGEVCPSVTWLEPPEKLRGLVGMPNGIMAGFFDNTVAFCDPYHPFAWPYAYQITTEHPIVGLAAFGQTLFVGTTGSPYFISGSDSASMSALKMDSSQSCTSRRSIVAVQGGVLYASADGLCVADGRGVQVITQGLFTREDWQKLTPSSIIAAEHEGIYYMRYFGGAGGTFTFDLAAKKLTRLRDFRASATFVDRLNDVLYHADPTAGRIRRLFGATTRRVGLWKSGRNAMPQHAALAWAQIEGFATPDVPVFLRVFGDGYFIDHRGVVYDVLDNGALRRRRDGRLFAPSSPEYEAINYTVKFTGSLPKRMPFGRWRELTLEMQSAARVTRLTLAGDTQELKTV